MKMIVKNSVRMIGGATLLIALSLVSTVFVPPPPSAVAQFVSQQTFAGTGGGTANAQSFTIANMTALVPGVPMTYIPSVTNTGPTTLNVSNIGAVATRRPSSIGLTSLSGGELQLGVLTTVVYDGTSINIVAPLDMRPIGDTMQFRGSATPLGYMIEDGSCVSQVTYAPLFSVIGTSYGSCSAGLFAIPDSRGTMFAALDTQGVNGAAGRITSGGSGCNATTVGLCGSQNITLALTQIPSGITTSGSNNIAVANAAQVITATNPSQSITVANAAQSITASGSNTITVANAAQAISVNSTGSSIYRGSSAIQSQASFGGGPIGVFADVSSVSLGSVVSSANNSISASGSNAISVSGTNSISASGSNAISVSGTNSISASGTNTITATSNNTGGLPHPLLNPVLLGRRAIKY